MRLAIIRTLPFLVVVCVIGVLIKRGKIKSQDLDLVPPFSIKRFIVCTVGFLLFTLTVEYLLSAISILEVSKWHHTFLPSIILIIGATVVAPIAEELIFRGLILNVLAKRKMNRHNAIFLQAIFFVLLHNFTYQNTLSSNIGIAQSLIDAMLFGYARYYTKSIYTPITMHITGNAIAIIERFIL